MLAKIFAVLTAGAELNLAKAVCWAMVLMDDSRASKKKQIQILCSVKGYGPVMGENGRENLTRHRYNTRPF